MNEITMNLFLFLAAFCILFFLFGIIDMFENKVTNLVFLIISTTGLFSIAQMILSGVVRDGGTIIQSTTSHYFFMMLAVVNLFYVLFQISVIIKDITKPKSAFTNKV